MEDTKRISQPTQGSEDVGMNTSDKRNTGAASAGTDTQLHLAAKSGNKNKGTNDDEKVVKNGNGQNEFLTSKETDE